MRTDGECECVSACARVWDAGVTVSTECVFGMQDTEFGMDFWDSVDTVSLCLQSGQASRQCARGGILLYDYSMHEKKNVSSPAAYNWFLNFHYFRWNNTVVADTCSAKTNASPAFEPWRSLC